ncbi:hypothetical protein WA026_012089 [Henosepilachna vigintioctopunctata]|uniref:Medium-chain acyl-CoA ligase ACSF2, mitochondrial n=1 Tax=Henosepilachna vigintioctopunctata TaxID=420089 RepID=A0AAW1V4X3_9CUCU
MVSHFSHVNNSLAIGRRIELDLKYHRMCLMNPFFHAAGVTASIGSCVSYGSTVVLPSATYSPPDNLTTTVKEKCSIIHGTPTMHLDLITEQEKRGENISPEIALFGGSPISPHQLETMLKVLKVKKLKNVYGQTEATCMIFSSKPGEDMEKSINSVGCLSDHTEAKIVDSDGNVVPFGTPGELYVRGYQNMIGYWEDADKTEATLGNDGWLKTGDRFILTEDGYGKIVGRNKDMIIRGGENIFPKEVEDVLITHPKIAEVSVIGLPHERLGEQICACVTLKENYELNLQELSNFCKGKMAHFKVPSQLKVLKSLPKTASGKIQKYVLVKQYSENISIK